MTLRLLLVRTRRTAEIYTGGRVYISQHCAVALLPWFGLQNLWDFPARVHNVTITQWSERPAVSW